MIIYLIRHGATPGNLEKRYIGTSDEALCDEGIRAVRLLGKMYGRELSQCSYVFASPLRRCVQTAAVLFPDKHVIELDKLRECDFGAFEGRNYQELTGSKEYQSWIDSNGTLPFPDGEDSQGFRQRCIEGFNEAVEILINYNRMCKINDDIKIALVVHGGTIMSILEHYENTHDYYGWQCGNSTGYRVRFTDGIMEVLEHIG